MLINNHAKFEQYRKNPYNIFAWDWAWSDGDTVKEKFENLYLMIRSLTNRAIHCIMPIVVCNEPLSLPLALDFDKSFIPLFKKIDDVVCLGGYNNILPDPNCINSFDLYKDTYFPDDEILIVSEKIKLIKVYNNPLIDKQT
jgi:hypothetical protein